jgi:hypothetical protein
MKDVKINARGILKEVNKPQKRITLFIDQEIADEFEANCPKKKMSQVAEKLFKLYIESLREK